MDIHIDPSTSPPSLRAQGSLGEPTPIFSKSSPLTKLKLKRGDQLPLNVHIIGSNSASALRLGVKAKNDYNSPLLLLAIGQPELNADGSIVFKLILNVNSRELNTAFGTDNRATGRSSIAAQAEFTWLEGTETRISDSLDVSIINDIIKGVDADAPTLPQNASIDQIYDAASSNAQSGLAVAQAIAVIQSIPGAKGDAGETGAKGEQGAKGDAGETGAKGEQGVKGDAGVQGTQGFQGVKGDAGATGLMPVLQLNSDNAIELTSGVMYRYTLASGATLINWADFAMESHADKVMTCELCIDARGYAAHSITWPPSWIWLDGQAAPDLSTGGLRYFSVRSDQGLTFVAEHTCYIAAQ